MAQKLNCNGLDQSLSWSTLEIVTSKDILDTPSSWTIRLSEQKWTDAVITFRGIAQKANWSFDWTALGKGFAENYEEYKFATLAGAIVCSALPTYQHFCCWFTDTVKAYHQTEFASRACVSVFARTSPAVRQNRFVKLHQLPATNVRCSPKAEVQTNASMMLVSWKRTTY